jgi:DNA-binding transcriptional regulator YiaG
MDGSGKEDLDGFTGTYFRKILSRCLFRAGSNLLTFLFVRSLMIPKLRIDVYVFRVYNKIEKLIRIPYTRRRMMKKKELINLEFIANGDLIENESIEGMESDRRKRLMAASFVAVRNMTGMNRKEFAEWLAIPYRTMQDWELGTSQVPEYVLRLVAYKVLIEKERGNL